MALNADPAVSIDNNLNDYDDRDVNGDVNDDVNYDANNDVNNDVNGDVNDTFDGSLGIGLKSPQSHFLRSKIFFMLRTFTKKSMSWPRISSF